MISDLEWVEELAVHLQDGSVAVLMEIVADPWGRIGGEAIALNSKGESIELSLHDIYSLARSLGDDFSFPAPDEEEDEDEEEEEEEDKEVDEP
jgi:hypothetical protein